MSAADTTSRGSGLREDMTPQAKAAHTPGPWTVLGTHPSQRLNEGWGVFEDKFICRRDGASLASVKYNCNYFTQPEIDANARLIASAPELLAIAQHIATMADDAYLIGHPEWEVMVSEARGAIAKAEGRAG